MDLEEKIELARKEMIDVVERHGLTSEETVECSRKLDNLINRFDATRKNSSEL